MVKISDCSCECRDKGKAREIEERALSSINKVLGTEGQAYYPDGTGAVTIPIADADQLAQIGANSEDIATLEESTKKISGDVAQMKISIDENTAHLTTIDGVLDSHAREIKGNSDEIAGLETLTDALTKELPTDFKLYKPSAGKIQLQYETEDASLINSNILDMVIPESYDIVSGTTSRSFKLQIQFSDGTTAATNDFVIPEGGGTSVSVTGITLTKSGNALKASINLDDGSSIESGTVQMVSSVAGTFANKQLVITVNGVSSVPIGIDVGGSYTAGTGIKIASGTISIDSTVVALKTDIQDMATKTEVAATYATKTTVQTLQNSVKDCFSDVDYDSTTQKLSFTALDGQVNEVGPIGGNNEDWEFIGSVALPTDINPGTQLIGSNLKGNVISGTSLIINNFTATYVKITDTYFTWVITGSGYFYGGSISRGFLISAFDLTLTYKDDGSIEYNGRCIASPPSNLTLNLIQLYSLTNVRVDNGYIKKA